MKTLLKLTREEKKNGITYECCFEYRDGTVFYESNITEITKTTHHMMGMGYITELECELSNGKVKGINADGLEKVTVYPNKKGLDSFEINLK